MAEYPDRIGNDVQPKTNANDQAKLRRCWKTANEGFHGAVPTVDNRPEAFIAIVFLTKWSTARLLRFSSAIRSRKNSRMKSSTGCVKEPLCLSHTLENPVPIRAR